MYTNVAYLRGSLTDMVDESRSMVVTSCGYYRVHSRAVVSTERPQGRRDYQLLYIAKGKGYFYFDGLEGKETVITEGNMVLFRPGEIQFYYYHAPDKTEVYWVHFTGGDVRNTLRHYDIPLNDHVFYCGTPSTYVLLFKQMIEELQTCRVGYEELLEMCFRELLLVVQRTRLEKPSIVSTQVQEEMAFARQYFHEHYNEPINIEDFAQSRHMSISLFMRNFKKVYEISPKQYILNLRMNNAQSLLETTDYTVSEIAAIVGYDNPLYFSRLYHKQKGQAPTDYRKLLKE